MQTRKQGLQDQTDAHRAMLDAWAHLHKDEVDKATGGGGAEGDEDDNSDDDHDNLSHQPSVREPRTFSWSLQCRDMCQALYADHGSTHTIIVLRFVELG